MKKKEKRKITGKGLLVGTNYLDKVLSKALSINSISKLCQSYGINFNRVWHSQRNKISHQWIDSFMKQLMSKKTIFTII